MKFIGRLFVCYECGTALQSKYPGHFCSCDCPAQSFVDQTAHYTRVGGKAVYAGK